MSIKYLTHVWENERDVKGTRLLLLLAYADSASNDDGSCWLSCGGAAKKIRGSEDNVRAMDKELMAAHKIIKVVGGGKKTPFGTTNLTVIVVPGVNCTSYEDLCKQYKVEPLPYKALPEDKRKGHNPFGTQTKDDLLNSIPLLNSSEGTLEFNTPLPLNSKVDPSFDPSLNRHDSSAVAESAEKVSEVNIDSLSGDEPPAPKAAKVKQPSEYQQFTQKLADICGENMALRSRAKVVGVNAGELWSAGYVLADLETFSTWWYANDWRGKKGQRPTLVQVKAGIEDAKQEAKHTAPAKPAQASGDSYGIPVFMRKKAI